MGAASNSVQVERVGPVACVELNRPPHNYLDHGFVAEIAEALDHLERDAGCRAVVLCAAGKSFSAGADLSRPGDSGQSAAAVRHPHLYKEALRLFAFPKPIMAAVHGAAIGRTTRVMLRPGAMPEASAWLERMRSFWSTKLTRFAESFKREEP